MILLDGCPTRSRPENRTRSESMCRFGQRREGFFRNRIRKKSGNERDVP